MTLLKIEINSTNFYSSLIKTKGCEMEMRDSVVKNTVNHFIIHASNSWNDNADELKTVGNTLIMLNTTISGNHIRSTIVGEIDGVFKILHCSIHNNNVTWKENHGTVISSRYQLNISHTAISFNSVAVLILCSEDLYAYDTRFTFNRALFGIFTDYIYLKFSKFEKNIINGTLVYITRFKRRKFLTDYPAI